MEAMYSDIVISGDGSGTAASSLVLDTMPQAQAGKPRKESVSTAGRPSRDGMDSLSSVESPTVDTHDNHSTKSRRRNVLRKFGFHK
jgi:hypothetical protein